jgi:hypothetical protein
MSNSGSSVLMIGAVCAIIAGCASNAQRARPRTITLGAFAATESQPRIPAVSPPGSEPESSASQPSATQSASSSPLAASPVEIEPGQPVIIDRVIGQVSGRPIFADALLNPIADQIRQEARRRSPEDFDRWIQQRVIDRLQEVILNELLLAEAEAALTEQQQQGLLAFLRDFQEKKLAEERGSRSQLERELQQEGMTPEKLVEFEKNKVLLQNLLSEKIQPRVIVSWKDIEREYERRKSEFNPSARVTLTRIRLDNQTQSVQIDEVKARLAKGEEFSAIAEAVGVPDGGAWDTFATGPGGVGDIPDLNEAYRSALMGLQEGQTTQPIELSGRTQWIHVAKVEQPQGKTLYDVQRELHFELRVRRQNQERERYLRTLFDKGIYSEIDQMARRLLAVAQLRYGRSSS